MRSLEATLQERERVMSEVQQITMDFSLHGTGVCLVCLVWLAACTLYINLECYVFLIIILNTVYMYV